MSGQGFKTFAVGDVLTASDVNGYLMSQAVLNFADSGARGSAIGTATEGMLSYLADTDAVEVYDGSAWMAVSGGGFTASTAITATDASWSVPTLADPVVRVTIIGGGGGGGASVGADGSDGTSSTFVTTAGTATALGGNGGGAGNSNYVGDNGFDGWGTGNGGNGGSDATNDFSGGQGQGGQGIVAYYDLDGIATANVTVGAGGAGGVPAASYEGGGDGGDGVVIVEYRAG